MPKIRVLVVDDAVVVRKLITETLRQDPDLEVVGAAANGELNSRASARVRKDMRASKNRFCTSMWPTVSEAKMTGLKHTLIV